MRRAGRLCFQRIADAFDVRARASLSAVSASAVALAGRAPD